MVRYVWNRKWYFDFYVVELKLYMRFIVFKGLFFYGKL